MHSAADRDFSKQKVYWGSLVTICNRRAPHFFVHFAHCVNYIFLNWNFGLSYWKYYEVCRTFQMGHSRTIEKVFFKFCQLSEICFEVCAFCLNWKLNIVCIPRTPCTKPQKIPSKHEMKWNFESFIEVVKLLHLTIYIFHVYMKIISSQKDKTFNPFGNKKSCINQNSRAYKIWLSHFERYWSADECVKVYQSIVPSDEC